MKVGMYKLFSHIFHVVISLLGDYGAIQPSPLQFSMLHIKINFLP
jgi:hypothetical protein